VAHHEHVDGNDTNGTLTGSQALEEACKWVDEHHDEVEAHDILCLLEELLNDAQRVKTAVSLHPSCPSWHSLIFSSCTLGTLVSIANSQPSRPASLMHVRWARVLILQQKFESFKYIITHHAFPLLKLGAGYQQSNLGNGMVFQGV